MVLYVCCMNTPRGILAFMPTIKEHPRFEFNTYLPHFFSRYAERVKVDKHGIELISHFFHYNKNYVSTSSSNKEFLRKWVNEDNESSHEQEIFSATMQDGVGLGFMTKKRNLLFKTFITYEMAKGNQEKHFAWKEIVREGMTPSLTPGVLSKEKENGKEWMEELIRNSKFNQSK